MTKGCQKKIYYLKNPGGRYFEEAYLVIRSDVCEKNGKISSTDLAAEAEKIVREAGGGFDIRKYTTQGGLKIGKAMSFALGAASSSALIGIAALIISLGC